MCLLLDFKIKEVFESINKLILNDIAPLQKEIRTVITEEFGKEVQTYYSILTAIAMGNTKLNEIANYVGMKETSLSAYLNDLIDILEVVKREIPITENSKSKKGRYYLKDNFFRFWFRFIYRYKSYYEVGNYGMILKDIQENFNFYVGLSFEEICKEFVTDLNEKKKLPFSFYSIGKWWGSYDDKNTKKRKAAEIDIVAINEETKEIIFIEVKWKNINARDAEKIIDELKEKSKFVEWYNKERREYFGIIAKRIDEKENLNKKGVIAFDLLDFEGY